MASKNREPQDSYVLQLSPSEFHLQGTPIRWRAEILSSLPCFVASKAEVVEGAVFSFLAVGCQGSGAVIFNTGGSVLALESVKHQ